MNIDEDIESSIMNRLKQRTILSWVLRAPKGQGARVKYVFSIVLCQKAFDYRYSAGLRPAKETGSFA